MYRAPNGVIYLSEHGASSDDEFQVLEPGRNYGWPNVEGFCDFSGEQTFCAANNVKEPLVVWTPTIAPSDLIWYENPNFPEWDGKMLMTVLKDKKIIALEMSPDGTQYVSQTHYLTNQFGRLRDICVGPQKEIYLATNGASWSNTNPNTHSIIRLKVASGVGISEESATDNIQLYPNPVGELLHIQVDESLVGSPAVITDFSGRVIASFEISSSQFSLPTSSFAQGAYYVLLRNTNGQRHALRFCK
jgi:hypothetical protein